MLSQLCALSSAAAKLKSENVTQTGEPAEISSSMYVCASASCVESTRLTFSKTSGECNAHRGLTWRVCFYSVSIQMDLPSSHGWKSVGSEIFEKVSVKGQRFAVSQGGSHPVQVLVPLTDVSLSGLIVPNWVTGNLNLLTFIRKRNQQDSGKNAWHASRFFVFPLLLLFLSSSNSRVGVCVCVSGRCTGLLSVAKHWCVSLSHNPSLPSWMSSPRPLIQQ